MKITIKRFKDNKSYEESFEIKKRVQTLLEALYYIRDNIDPSLSFDAGCRSGICGACSLRMDSKERLACTTKIEDRDITIEPLRYHRVLRDLRVDKSKTKETIKRASSYLHNYSNTTPTPKDEAKNELQSDCILCDSCYSACPVFEVNSSFLGPFALSRAYRYEEDIRESDKLSILNAIQNSGIWDCTLCGECTAVCPQSIDPKTDILNLRSISMQNGFSDPNMDSMSFDMPSFLQ